MTTDVLESIKARIAAGEAITPAALTKAKATAELNELIAAVEADQNEEATEAARLRRIAEIVIDLEAGSPDELAAILTAYDQLVTAIEAIAEAVTDYAAQLDQKIDELTKLEPLPLGVVARRVGDNRELQSPNSIFWPQPGRLLPQLIAEAAWKHLPTWQHTLFRNARGRLDMSALDPIRKAINTTPSVTTDVGSTPGLPDETHPQTDSGTPASGHDEDEHSNTSQQGTAEQASEPTKAEPIVSTPDTAG